MIDVTPPDPASLRIGGRVRTGAGLRIENDQLVGIRPGVVTGVVHETPADLTCVLLAAVEGDVNAASAALLAVRRHEYVSVLSQTQRIRLLRSCIDGLIILQRP